jgi:hypothetical protein
MTPKTLKDDMIVLESWMGMSTLHRLVVLRNGALSIQYLEGGEWKDGRNSGTDCEVHCLPVFE